MRLYLSKSLVLLFLISIFIPLTVSAAVEIKNPLEHKTFELLLKAIVNFLIKLAIAIVPIMIVIAGYYFVTAGGEPEKIATAKKIILYTLIGLLIVLSAWGLIEVIENIFKTS